jgi:hypothetical protein
MCLQIPDGFTAWPGGDNPAPGKTVQVICRNGEVSIEKPSERLNWYRAAEGTSDQLCGGPIIHVNEDWDILAYRVI